MSFNDTGLIKTLLSLWKSVKRLENVKLNVIKSIFNPKSSV